MATTKKTKKSVKKFSPLVSVRKFSTKQLGLLVAAVALVGVGLYFVTHAATQHRIIYTVGLGATGINSVFPDGTGTKALQGSYDSNVVSNRSNNKVALRGLFWDGSKWDGVIFTESSNGFNRVQLTKNAGGPGYGTTGYEENDSWPAMNSQGTKVAYDRLSGTYNGNGSVTNAKHDLRIVNLDGTGDHIVYSSTQPIYPKWIPGSDKVIVNKGADNGLTTMKSDGTSINQINLPSGFSSLVDVSGGTAKRLLFYQRQPNGTTLLATMNLNGTNVKIIGPSSPNPLHFYDSQANLWNSDGSQLTYMNLNGTNYELHVVNWDGTANRTIYSSTSPIDAPFWSYDNLKIAFSDVYDGDPGPQVSTYLKNIHTINPDGTGLATPVANVNASGGFETW